MLVFVVGATAAVIAAGLGWRLLDPPLVLEPFTSAPLVGTLLLYGLPVVTMSIGAGLAWAERASSRLVLLVSTLLTGMLFAPTLAQSGADLFGGHYVTSAVVLATYDCDRLDADGQPQVELTCVELSWTRPDGRASRDRFVMADHPGLDALDRGTCVIAHLWPANDRLVSLHRTGPGRCDADRVGRGSEF